VLPEEYKEVIDQLLTPIDIGGPRRIIYSYRHEHGFDYVWTFLEDLKKRHSGRYTRYMTIFRYFGLNGGARGDVWHMLDPEKAPKGIDPKLTPNGVKIAIQGIGEFKNIAHKSRILHCNDEGGLCILLTPYKGKKEDDLTADALNPAIAARAEYERRRDQLIAEYKRKHKGRKS